MFYTETIRKLKVNPLDIYFTLRSRVKIPSVLLNAYHTGQTLDHHHPALGRMSSLEISELVQWSDMILFDYITGHYDR